MGGGGGVDATPCGCSSHEILKKYGDLDLEIFSTEIWTVVPLLNRNALEYILFMHFYHKHFTDDNIHKKGLFQLYISWLIDKCIRLTHHHTLTGFSHICINKALNEFRNFVNNS